MIYELIDGHTDVINVLVKDGWKIENTFPNPYPQPYFFALMRLDHPNEDEYDVAIVVDVVLRRQGNINMRWSKTANASLTFNLPTE